jgi:hypothetical protein
LNDHQYVGNRHLLAVNNHLDQRDQLELAKNEPVQTHEKSYDIDEPFKVTTPLNELQSHIESHKDQREVQITDRMADQTPYNPKRYQQCLAKNRRNRPPFFDTNPDGMQPEPVRSIYVNEPKSFEAVRIQIKEALKTEDLPFRIRFSIGFITER